MGYNALIDPGATSYDPPDVPDMALPDKVTRLVTDNLYSAHRFAVGAFLAGNFPVFVTALRAAGQGFAIPLSILHTNLQTPGMIPSGQAYILRKIGVQFFPGNDPDDNLNFLRHTAVVMRKGTYERVVGPSCFYPGGGGPTGFAATTLPVTDLREVVNGAPGFMAMAELETPITLGSQEQFNFEFQALPNGVAGVPVNTAELCVWLRLFGEFAESVQA